MVAGGIDDGATTDEPEARTSRLVVPLARNRDVDLVVDSDYAMFVVYGDDTYALPQNSLLTVVALALVTGVVVHRIATSAGRAFGRGVSAVDRAFERVYALSRATNRVLASERTGRALTNVEKILVILALLLFLLDSSGAVDVVGVPTWLLSL